jgi:hypothetical protein
VINHFFKIENFLEPEKNRLLLNWAQKSQYEFIPSSVTTGDDNYRRSDVAFEFPGTRIPRSEVIVERIIAIAEELEDVRKFLGNKPMTINSWYRTPEVNSRIGGASNSRHMIGDAVDFTIEDCHPFDVYAKLDDWWGERGGLGKGNSFTHVDLRGSCARWDY